MKPSSINLDIFQAPLALSSMTGCRLDYTIFRLDYRCDWRDQKQPPLCRHFYRMFHAVACCVFKTAFSTHRHPAHLVSVPIRHPRGKRCVVTSFETDICLHRKYNKIPGTYMVYSCVCRPGCPGAWRRGSWHFQVASLHLQSIMDLCPLHIIFLFFLPEQA